MDGADLIRVQLTHENVQNFVIERGYQAGVGAGWGVALDKCEVGSVGAAFDQLHVVDATAGGQDKGRLNNIRAHQNPCERVPESVIGTGFRTGRDDNLLPSRVARKRAKGVKTANDHRQCNNRCEDGDKRDRRSHVLIRCCVLHPILSACVRPWSIRRESLAYEAPVQRFEANVMIK